MTEMHMAEMHMAEMHMGIHDTAWHVFGSMR